MKKIMIICFIALLCPVQIQKIKGNESKIELDVTISTKLDITMKADGTTTVSTINVKNNSKVNEVFVKSMKLTPNNGWSLKSEYYDMHRLKANTKAIKFGLNRNDDIEWFDEDEGLTVGDTLTMSQSKSYSFSVERTAFTKRVDTQNAFNLEITITDIPFKEYAHEPVIMNDLLNGKLLVSDSFEFDESTGTLISYIMNYDDYKVIIPKEVNGIPVKIIGSNFASMVGNKKIVIPNGVMSIESDALRDAGDYNEEFVLPPSITYVGDGAIALNATSIKFTSLTPPVFDMQYNACISGDSDRKIYVPKASLNAYYDATDYYTSSPKVEGKIVGY